MKSNAVKFLAPRTTVLRAMTLIVLAGCVLFPLAQAQQVYRIVGPDGKITFSDQPPPVAGNAKVSAGSSTSAGAAASVSANLPFELRQVTAKYPVTLYTGENCGPCGAGRSLLTSRGIPFTEKTVATNEDIEALRRLSSDTALPFMTIGSQQLKGFSDAEWTQFLTAAGYPTTSALPPSYRRPAATPLVAVVAAPAAAEAKPARVSPAPAPVAQPNENPAGIKF